MNCGLAFNRTVVVQHDDGARIDEVAGTHHN